MQSTIYTNMDSVRNYNVFNKNASNASRAMERATTGLKIVSAKDNASQYAISEKMLERINANNQASQNVQTDNALTRTASGGIANTIDILKALKAKAIDAANDSNTDADRLNIQKDVDQLIAQINTNAQNVKFNGKTLLDGSYDESVGCATKTALMAVVSSPDDTLNALGLIDDGETATAIVSWADATGKVNTDKTISTLACGAKLSEIMTSAGDKVTNVTIKKVAGTSSSAANTDAKDKINQTVKTNETGFVAVADTAGASTRFSGLTIKLVSNTDPSKSLSYTFDTVLQRGKDAKTDGGLSFQIGELSGMSIDLAIENMSAGSKGLGISGLDVKSKDNAQGSIGVIDNAITAALQQQTSIGAMEARLGYTADTLDTINENLQASNSAIRDADMAKEVSNYMKWNVLMQASQYMLAQSNQNAFATLNLLQ